MKRRIAILVAALAAGCSPALPPGQGVRAPAGWETFCFPITVGFHPGRDEITPGTRVLFDAVYGTYLRDSVWVSITVSARQPDGKADLGLAGRRARAARHLVTSLGHLGDRIQLDIDRDRAVDVMEKDLSPLEPESRMTVEVAAYVTAMIPPQEVARLQRLYEESGLVVC